MNIRKPLSEIIFITVMVAASGCETIATLKDDYVKNKVYSGTVSHVKNWCVHARCLDAPFSFVLDTALLPVTLPWTAYEYIVVDSSDESFD